MPVSATRLSRQATYPDTSTRKPGNLDHHHPVFQTIESNSLYRSGPVHPDRTSRQQRMSWAASWRSQRPQRFWGDSFDSLPHERENVAYDVVDSTKDIYQALPAPTFSSLTFAPPTSYERKSATEDDEDSDYSAMNGSGSEWSDYEDEIMVDTHQSTSVVDEDYSPNGAYASSLIDDMSPVDEADPRSSPGPLTPFGEFIDRAVTVPTKGGHMPQPAVFQSDSCGSDCQQCPGGFVPAEKSRAPPPIITPTATEAYRNLADNVSVWIADYVWKLCNAVPRSAKSIPPRTTLPPTQLASNVRSLLLSTILQPSAIFLALKYISLLPVYLGPMYLSSESTSERDFRDALLGHPDAYDREEQETEAPFKLIVLGFMFANKWLDDHTFSNKTWQSISGISVRSLNKLESLALRVFRYDLNVSADEWRRWLSYLLTYHNALSVAPAHHPAPIARPISTPHSLIGNALVELVSIAEMKQCEDECCGRRGPAPIFTGLAERVHRRQAADEPKTYDIDLDEDGPLREEYLPKRRSSTSSTSRSCRNVAEPVESRRSGLYVNTSMANRLPPPAKWSPEGDELVDRGGNYPSRQYPASRTIFAHSPAPADQRQVLAQIPGQWPRGGDYAPQPPYDYRTSYAAPGVPASYAQWRTSTTVSPPTQAWGVGNGRAIVPALYQQHPTTIWCRA